MHYADFSNTKIEVLCMPGYSGDSYHQNTAVKMDYYKLWDLPYLKHIQFVGIYDIKMPSFFQDPLASKSKILTKAKEPVTVYCPYEQTYNHFFYYGLENVKSFNKFGLKFDDL